MIKVDKEAVTDRKEVSIMFNNYQAFANFVEIYII